MNNGKRDSILPKLRSILQNSMYMETQALRHILDYHLISIVYQPIKALPTGETIAYQALVRGPMGSNYELPNSLFAAADFYKCRWEIEALYLQEAMAGTPSLMDNRLLFLAIDPRFLASWEYDVDFILYCSDRYQLSPEHIVLNIGQPGQMIDSSSLRLRLSKYREAGLKLAMHDYGNGSIERSIAMLEPDFLIMPPGHDCAASDSTSAFSGKVKAGWQVSAANIYEEIWNDSAAYLRNDHKQNYAAFRVS